MEGYRWTGWKRETVSGFPTLRVPEYPSHDASAIRRMATFGSFALSSATLAARSIGSADIALVYSSPATAALPAMVARARWGTPYVLQIQDLWPDSFFEAGFVRGAPLGIAGSLASSFVQASYRGASHVCVITPGMRRALIERGVPEQQVTVVFNWVDEVTLRPVPSSGVLRDQLGLARTDFIALFAGNAGEAQGLMAWVEAFGRLSDMPTSHLAFLGGGTQRERLQAAVEAHRLGHRVHFLDAVPSAQVAPLVADADVSVVSLADRPLFRITMPSKLQAALAMGSPVIASCAGDVADVVQASGAGWVAKPEDSASIAETVRAAVNAGPDHRSERGGQGLRFYQERMSRHVGSALLADVLDAAVEDRSRRRQRKP